MNPEWVDLAARSLGGSVVAANDETFAPKEQLIDDRKPAFTPGVFGPRGQVYDGWETRRRREQPGPDDGDWVLVRLGAPGVVHRVVVDTRFFTGNYPPECELATCWVDGWPSADEVAASPNWQPITGRVPLQGDQPNVIDIAEPALASHVRLTIRPDGGVARLRVLGEVLPDPRRWAGVTVDLAAAEHGGRVLDCSDRFYSPPEHVLLPGAAATMADGWETRRRREPGNDWLVVGLGAPGQLRQVVVDTSRFVGNAPGAVRLTGCSQGDIEDWVELFPRTGVQPDTVHWFGADAGLDTATVVDRVRCELIPDGGLARLRLVGVPSPAGRAAAGLRWWNALPAADAAVQVAACNASHAWATALVAGRPYADLNRLAESSDEILATIPWPNIEQALAAHPRIGRSPQGSDRESAASRAEQSGVSDEAALRAALAEANRAYEHRFGHVFLARARGRSGDELLALLRQRLGNDEETEQGVVCRELAEITSLRLRELW